MLLGGIPVYLPLWKMMEFVSWDDDYSQYDGKVIIRMFQSPPPSGFFLKVVKKVSFPIQNGWIFPWKKWWFSTNQSGCWLRMAAHGAGGWVSGSTQPRTQALARRAFGTSKRHSSGPTLVIPWWFQWWSMDIHSTNYPLVMSTVCYWKWP